MGLLVDKDFAVMDKEAGLGSLCMGDYTADFKVCQEQIDPGRENGSSSALSFKTG